MIVKASFHPRSLLPTSNVNDVVLENCFLHCSKRKFKKNMIMMWLWVIVVTILYSLKWLIDWLINQFDCCWHLQSDLDWWKMNVDFINLKWQNYNQNNNHQENRVFKIYIHTVLPHSNKFSSCICYILFSFSCFDSFLRCNSPLRQNTFSIIHTYFMIWTLGSLSSCHYKI